jgi:NAD(P)-dependent dehydrogenase (short-subunit alcohol dehydrogenase family)
LGVTVVEGVDVAEPAATKRIREAVGGKPLDLIVANAALNSSFDVARVDDLDLRSFEEDLRVNVVGAVRSVLAALPDAKQGSRILLMSSGVAAPGPPITGSLGYGVTKAALNHFARLLAAEVAGREIIVAAVSPGPTNTAMLQETYAAGRSQFDPSDAPPPAESALRTLEIAERATLATSGSFWSPAGLMYLGPEGLPPAS